MGAAPTGHPGQPLLTLGSEQTATQSACGRRIGCELPWSSVNTPQGHYANLALNTHWPLPPGTSTPNGDLSGKLSIG